MHHKRIFGALAAAALVLGACSGDPGGGSSSGSSDAAEIVTLSAEKTTEAGTAKASFEGDVEAQGQTFTFTGAGEVDMERNAAHMTMDLGQMVAAMGGGNSEMEIVMIDLVMYMRAPFLTAQLPGAKEWLELDLAEAARMQGMDMSQFTGFGSNDPTQQLEFLKGVSEDVEEVGSEEIRGVETTHYKVTVNLQDVVDQLEGPTKAQYQRIVQQGGVKEIPMDVWVDAEGRLAKMTYTLEMPLGPSAPGENVSTTITMELYDYGTDVTIQPPPASETSDFFEVLGGLGPQSGSDSATIPPEESD